MESHGFAEGNVGGLSPDKKKRKVKKGAGRALEKSSTEITAVAPGKGALRRAQKVCEVNLGLKRTLAVSSTMSLIIVKGTVLESSELNVRGLVKRMVLRVSVLQEEDLVARWSVRKAHSTEFDEVRKFLTNWAGRTVAVVGQDQGQPDLRVRPIIWGPGETFAKRTRVKMGRRAEKEPSSPEKVCWALADRKMSGSL